MYLKINLKLNRLFLYSFYAIIILLSCIRDKTIEPEIKIPPVISFQQTSLDSLNISTVTTSKEGILYASSTVGKNCNLYRSIDKGDTWEIVLSKLSVFHMAFKNNKEIFACYSGGPWQPSSILRSIDNGLSWELLPNPGQIPTSFVFNQSGWIFLGDAGGEEVWKGEVYLSEDNGVSWQRTGFPDSVGVRTMIITEKGDIFAGTQKGIYRSSDNSISWVRVFGNSSENIKRPIITHLYINPVNEDIYATSAWEIFRSENNGETWKKIKWPTFSSYINSFIISSRGDIFIAVSQPPGANTLDGLFYSQDEGNNWEKIDNGIENMFVGHLSFDPDGYLYAGTLENGVFRTVNSLIY